ncbi:hypothetical protein [Priestia filamentosa]|nr:hypothetical protein [Priestia filamentosa]MDT3765256.1 hypothetical protein [Priestia filamentosa]WCM15834.1 hypothetical protein PGN40_21420 [Priestia filamentosa]WRU95543.1 hypothetical protein RYX51_00035 [Priestia filamentosa]SMF64843.1 hypothetical protein SAMN06296056_1082 [Priestia filamentosa]
MVNILVQDLKAGFVVKEDVCSQDGHIIMPKGMRLQNIEYKFWELFSLKR